MKKKSSVKKKANKSGKKTTKATRIASSKKTRKKSSPAHEKGRAFATRKPKVLPKKSSSKNPKTKALETKESKVKKANTGISKKKDRLVKSPKNVIVEKNKTNVQRPSQKFSTKNYAIPSLSKRMLSAPVLVVAGEQSGDLLGSEILLALQRQGFSRFFGTGGDTMQSAGAEIIEHIRTMNVMGFVEALKAWRRLKKLAVSLADEAESRKTRLAVLIDYPGFNLRLAAMLKARGIQVVFVVSPQLWAWHYSRIRQIQKYVDLMLPLFPFEEEMYRKEGIPAKAIGHPMVQRIPRELRREPLLAIPKRIPKRTIGLVPGSRFGEVSRLLPDMLGAAHILQEREKKTRFLLACADESLLSFIEKELEKFSELNVEVCLRQTYRIMQESDALMIASGTATLEAAYFKTPMVLLYRVSPLNLFIGSLLIRIRYVGIVNILGRRPTILELLQAEVTPENIVLEIEHILGDANYRENMITELSYVRRQLGSGNPAQKAALAITAFLAGEEIL